MKRMAGLISVTPVWTLVLVLCLGAVASAATKEVMVDVKCTTGKPVPVAITMEEVREAIGVDFAANWDSLRVVDASGKEIPFQIDDVDLSNTVSKRDELAFLAKGPCKIVVKDSAAEKPSFPSQLNVAPGEKGNIAISTLDGKFVVQVTNMGTVDVLKYNGAEHKYVKDLGMIRYAGFPYSTYWYDKDLGKHEEKTSFEEPLRVVKLTVLTNAPVRATVVVQTASDLFPGLRQFLVTSVYATGDIRVSNRIVTAGYSDLTKLFTMANAVMADFEDAVHMLPMFRYLDWAEELGVAPTDYWKSHDAVMNVDGRPYVVFADTRGPKPPWWGASYLFASAERWRTNFSPKAGVGVAEILLTIPEVSKDLVERLKGEGWHLEGEWRTGYFRWIAAEIIDVRKKHGITININPDMSEGDWPLHMIPGNSMEHLNYYVVYEAKDRVDAIRFLEARHAELASVALK